MTATSTCSSSPVAPCRRGNARSSRTCCCADVAILLTAARSASEPLRGPALDQLSDSVPMPDVRRAIRDSLEPLLGDLVGDERNVLLTLARMVVTLEETAVQPSADQSWT